MSDLNQTLFLTLNAGDAPNAAVLAAARFIATFAIAIIPLKLCVDWLRAGPFRATAFSAFIAILLGLAGNQIIGWFVFLPRPAVAGIGHTWLAYAADSSFPSDHATVMFSAAMAYRIARFRLGAGILACFGVIVSWGRVYLGVHFPLDILGAALVSIIAGFTSAYLMRGFGGQLFKIAESAWRTLFSGLINRGWARY